MPQDNDATYKLQELNAFIQGPLFKLFSEVCDKRLALITQEAMRRSPGQTAEDLAYWQGEYTGTRFWRDLPVVMRATIMNETEEVDDESAE